jgi:hypothetical protein
MMLPSTFVVWTGKVGDLPVDWHDVRARIDARAPNEATERWPSGLRVAGRTALPRATRAGDGGTVAALSGALGC